MKRTAFVRKTPMRSYASAEVGLSPRECDWCGKEFTPHPSRPLANICKPKCALDRAKAKEQAQKEAGKLEAKADRAKKEAAKTKTVLKGEAQEAFNEFVRCRDRDLPCVSCGVENPPMTTGGQWDAGHFLSRGSHPELAFDEDNCHKQCKKCNGGGGRFKHKDRTVSAKYEAELPNRIGVERLERLRGPHPPAKRTEDDYRALRATYKAKLRALKAQREAAA